jgi:tetratricopeptide (TPR) repeat protein
MNKLILAALFIFEIVLGGWCWSYSTYKNTLDKAISRYELRQDLAAAVLLKEFRQSTAGTLYSQIPFLSGLYDRAVSDEATARMRLGETQAASELFQQVSSSKYPEIQHVASYNLALLHIQRGDFISARAELGNALHILPDDLDSKNNLEILVRKEKERKAKNPDLQGRAMPPQGVEPGKDSPHFPEDLWRFEKPEHGENTGTEIRRRYL